MVRGKRYGICAGNGSGKSTLLRAIRDGKVRSSRAAPWNDGLTLKERRWRISLLKVKSEPSWWNMLFKEKMDRFRLSISSLQVRLHVSFRSFPLRLTLLDVVDPQLADVPRTKIRDQLNEVGFDDERQEATVGSLSGGWKMKLELARAMLYKVIGKCRTIVKID